MKRRDFLALSAAAASAAIPLALAEPAYGGDWQEMYVGDYWGAAEIADRPTLRAHALKAFQRRMKADGLTEIRHFREEVTWDPKRQKHFHLATASLR